LHIAAELIDFANRQEFEGSDVRRAARELDTTIEDLIETIIRTPPLNFV